MIKEYKGRLKMNWFEERKLKKQFLELVANAEPFEFIDIHGQKVKIKPYGDPTIGNFTIYLEYSTVDCNNKVRIIKESKYIPSDKLYDFIDYYESIKFWMDRDIKSFYSLYKEEMGYKNDYERLKTLKLENCIYFETDYNSKYVRSYMLTDFKRAMLYLQVLNAEGLSYLDEYKRYIFSEFKCESESVAQRYKRSKTPITADEPTVRYDNYSKWLISYQEALENIAREKEIASKVENLDKLLEEINEN